MLIFNVLFNTIFNYFRFLHILGMIFGVITSKRLMNNIKYICLIIFCSYQFNLMAQVDSRNKSIKIPAIKTEEKKDTINLDLKADSKVKEGEKDSPKNKISGINNPDKSFDLNTPKKPFSMIDNNKLRDPGELFEERWRKKAEGEGIRPKSMDDQFMGEYRIYAKQVNLLVRDHKFPDGDIVRIFLNEEVVATNILLTGSHKTITVNLADGINKIDFQALNQGDSGPNTAELIIYDDKGNLVSSKEWNLLTGVKATIVFVNEKPLGYKEETTENTKKEKGN